MAGRADRAALAGDEQAFAVGLRPRGPVRRLLGSRAVRAALGAAAGLLVAEGAFRVRDGGAFPHLNVYVADEALGARLRPGATERVRVATNAPTRVRINGAGFRGEPWPARSRREAQVVVVGDSQVFGLGVEETETFAARLDAAGLGVAVRNAGVPTHGPPEYNAVLAGVMSERPVRAVVYVVNLANDLFEVARPNRERHAVWDGWAVRKESAPADAGQGSWLGSLVRRESHAVFAARQWLYYLRGGGALDREGLPSEGTWRDLLGEDEAARAVRARREAAEGETRARLERAGQAVSEAAGRYHEARGLGPPPPPAPVDIVSRRSYGEGARPIEQTAYELSLYDADLQRRVVRYLDDAEAWRRRLDAADRALDRAYQDLAAEQRTASATRQAVLPSPLAPALREAQRVCAEHDARLVVVALPLDVQVSSAEWAKYRVASPLDVTGTSALAADVVTSARALGALAVDTTEALRAAEPGAFLQGDLHLTPRGHEAVARAIAPVLREALADPHARP